MLYIAYGSNISEKRIHERCPGAKFITKGIVEHYTLQFHYYADIVPAHDYELPVVIWDIPEEEIGELDNAEGFPKHYIKKQLGVIPEPRLNIEEMTKLVGAENVREADFYGPDKIIATAYVMTNWKKSEWEKHNQQTPNDYVEHLITGYKEQGFEGLHLRDLWYALNREEKPPEHRS